MASRVTCFLSLALLLEGADVAKLQDVEFKMSTARVDKFDQKVELKCEVRTRDVQGCNWVFQKAEPKSKPIFISYLSFSRSRDEGSWFSAQRNGDEYTLTLKKFGEENQGYYFCLVFKSSKLFFSPLVPLFLQGKSTTTPVPRPPTTVTPKGTSQPLRPEVCRPGAKGSVERTGLDFTCDIYIWAPLAGLCGALLLSLVITLICCHRNRRQVCKCPRPQVRQGGKTGPSEKFV